MGPTKSIGDRTKTIAKLAAARAPGIQRNNPRPADNGGGTGSAIATDTEQPVWDEEDMMLFLGATQGRPWRDMLRKSRSAKTISTWRAGSDM